MTFSESSIHKVVPAIASKDPISPIYLKGLELVKFFNSLGFSDSYEFAKAKE